MTVQTGPSETKSRVGVFPGCYIRVAAVLVLVSFLVVIYELKQSYFHEVFSLK